MRQQRALLLGLLTSLLAGCAAEETAQPTGWLGRLRPFQGPTGPDVVHLQVALLECSVGDRYINEDMWSLADEQQVVDLERKGILEDNGWRVGQLGGITPPRLQELLLSERSCANPRRIEMRAGNAKTLVLGPTLAQVRFQLHSGRAEPMPVCLDQAQCSLVVVPSLTRDGRTRLKLTPQVRHGEPELVFRGGTSLSDVLLQQQWPTETYAEQSWEVTLAANEYVVVGARWNRPQTLGYECLVRPDEPRPVQRLLVIRTGPPSTDVEGDLLGGPGEDKQAPPVAFQASISSARGSSPGR
jgi:hypothetical protein